MGKFKFSVIVLVALGLVSVASIVGRLLFAWEWWPFLIILSTMAFGVGLALTLVQYILSPHH